MEKFRFIIITLLSNIIFLIGSESMPANSNSKFEYINPLPNSSYVSVKSSIIIRPGGIIDKATINDDLIYVTGSKSGYHSGKFFLADDFRTLIFTPITQFDTDENVSVTLKDGLTDSGGLQVGSLSFEFHTSKNISTFNYAKLNNYSAAESNLPQKIKTISDSTLPPDLPEIIINQSNNPSPGYLFLCPSPYLMIVDNEGTPVFYRNVQGTIFDFDLQPTGELTYFIYPVSCYGLDSSLNLTRTYNTTDGFTPDVHELRVLPNGDYFIFGKRNVTVDMSKIVNGGFPNADVIDGALQEFDPDGNLIFEWDAIDHYKITDVDSYVDLTQPTIDFTHFNSAEIDSDGNLLISARNLDEITKVDRNTGEIIWRWGGKNNQFKFINDDLGFSRQHDIRRFSNGNISLFDNGVYHPAQASSAVEYKLDEINKTATLVKRITREGIFTNTEGSVEELPDGSRFISWGHNWNPVVSEIRPDDSVAYEISYPEYYDTYRSFRYKWETNFFKTSTDTLNFGYVAPGDSASKSLTIYNPQNSEIMINEFYCVNPFFSTDAALPIYIQPEDSIKITVKFKPATNGIFSDSFNIRNISIYQGTRQMIAKQVTLTGTTEAVSSVNENKGLPGQFKLYQNYPNPFNPATEIDYSIPNAGFVTLKVYDMLGNEISTLVNEEKPAGNYNALFNGSRFASGIYFYRMQVYSPGSAGYFIDTKKFILMK